MASETFNLFGKFAGKRVSDSPELQQACETLDKLPCSDLLSLLTVTSQTRSTEIRPAQVIEGNRFNKPSLVSQRDFYWIEGVIHEVMGEDVEFVELSPLQPYGINQALANTNQKNIVTALRRSEVNADATTALFRLAYADFLSQPGVDVDRVRIATNTRTVRAQSFGDNSGFLPHFKVFGEVTVGAQSGRYGESEMEAIVDHLGAEVDILDSVAESERSEIEAVDICVGNISLLGDLIERGLVDVDEARANTANPDYNMVEENCLDIPEYVEFDSADIGKTLRDLGFSKGVKSTEMFRARLLEKRPDLSPRIRLHLGRVAGIGYYRNMCYKFSATNNKGIEVPIADGGSTDWAILASGNKQLFTVTSGIGTELVCQYLISK